MVFMFFFVVGVGVGLVYGGSFKIVFNEVCTLVYFALFYFVVINAMI